VVGLIRPDTLLEDPVLPLKQGALCESIGDAFTHLQNNKVLP
jgi:hypothetical protein